MNQYSDELRNSWEAVYPPASEYVFNLDSELEQSLDAIQRGFRIPNEVVQELIVLGWIELPESFPGDDHRRAPGDVRR